jgi:mRNA interferase MazF
MEKDFDGWNFKKKKIHTTEYTNKKFKEGEIWWCSAGLNIGHEIDGKHNTFERPFYILNKSNKRIFIGIPCTSTFREGVYTYHLLTSDINFILNFSQIKTLSSKRLLRKIVHVPNFYKNKILVKFIKYIKRKPTR